MRLQKASAAAKAETMSRSLPCAAAASRTWPSDASSSKLFCDETGALRRCASIPCTTLCEVMSKSTLDRAALSAVECAMSTTDHTGAIVQGIRVDAKVP